METKKTAFQAGKKSPVNIAVPEACMIGLIAALGAVLLKNGVGIVGTMRVHLAGISPYFLPIIGLLGGLLVGLLIRYVDRGIAGSGIPQTKAALFGFPISLGVKSAVTKLLGCVISLGSGMALGREGPTVQVAAGLSSAFSKLRKTSPVHNTQLIAAGAGAGLAAAFNAPLAGVLFVLEELIKKMSGFAVGTTVVACFVASVTSRLVGVHSLDINLSELFPKATFAFQDIPFLVVLGVLSGLCGAIFNKTIIASLSLNRDILRCPPILATSTAGLMTGMMVMVLPDTFCNYAGLRELTFQSDTNIQIIAIALVVQFALTVLAYSSGVPGGLFAPSLTMGACLGHLVAVGEQQLIHSGDIGTMAVVGMGAFFCAVARVPITSVIIIFEMTTDFNLVLPLMICCVVAYLVAEQLDPGSLYDQLVSWSGMNLEEKEDGSTLDTLLANSFMTERVKTIPLSATLAHVKNIFETNTHQGYPVVDPSGKVVGIVARPDLLSTIQNNLKPETPVKKFMTASPITIRADEPLSSVLFLMDRFKVSRLPVTQREKLIGIITRKDIVAAQSQATGIRAKNGTRSYVAYQTRAREAGSGRLLLGIADTINQKSFSAATKIALGQEYELEFLHVITIPPSQNPAAADISTESSRAVLVACEQSGRRLGIPTHTSIRITHNYVHALAETIESRNIDMFLMQFQTRKTSKSADFSVQSILNNTNCKTVLLGRNYESRYSRFYIPVADFLNGELALEVAEHLAHPDSEIIILQIQSSKKNTVNTLTGHRIDEIKNTWKNKKRTELRIESVVANSPSGLLANLNSLTQADVLIMGLPRGYLAKSINKGLFKRNLKAFEAHSSVILTTE
ncbi:MAG: chloride channel protein [Cyanobacteria bacterium PR.3.49]|nr:chloride channel protein [Cyanobacteria bacterium PR.3.49]